MDFETKKITYENIFSSGDKGKRLQAKHHEKSRVYKANIRDVIRDGMKRVLMAEDNVIITKKNKKFLTNSSNNKKT